MRHLPARGQLITGGGGGAGLSIGLGATGPGSGPRGTHEPRTKRGPWGSEFQGGLKARGGGCGRGSGGSDFIWLGVQGVWVGRGKLVDSGLRRAAGSGRGRCYCFRGVRVIAGRRYRVVQSL